MPHLSRLPLCLLFTIPLAVKQTAAKQSVTAGVPLHIRVTHTARLRTGTPVHGVLAEPIYVRDRLILPAGSAVSKPLHRPSAPRSHGLRRRS